MPTRRYTIHRRDGSTTEVDADGMWPEGAHLVFRYSEVVILQPRELVALRVPIAEISSQWSRPRRPTCTCR
ncbi:MAG: hypothetical protein ABJA86_11555 [Nocardioidaceae bacterium]